MILDINQEEFLTEEAIHYYNEIERLTNEIERQTEMFGGEDALIEWYERT
jgi:hypothetical protein